MTRPRGLAYVALAGATLALACGDASTAPNAAPETVVVSIDGIAPGDAGIVLAITGAADDIRPVSPSLEMAWVSEASDISTIVLVGPLADAPSLLVIRRRGGLAPLHIEVREIAGADGTLSSPSSARATIRAANAS
jgi:hypothetical protein